MKATNSWITYRTRFLVKGKQLTTSLAFTDSLGRQHSGRKGDYLMESSDGVLRIVPRQIFEDIYVPLLAGEQLGSERLAAETPEHGVAPQQSSAPRQYQTLLRRLETPALLLPHLTRKSPQPYRDRRSSTSGLRSL
jgi:hypothetical protein